MHDEPEPRAERNREKRKKLARTSQRKGWEGASFSHLPPPLMSSKVFEPKSIQELVDRIHPDQKLDPAAELVILSKRISDLASDRYVVWQILLEIAEEFVDDVARKSCELAKHRKSKILDVQDVQLHLGVSLLRGVKNKR
jgi:histone H3/H4